MKATVIGAGAWGTALSVLIAKGGNDVVMRSHDLELAEYIEKNRENPRLSGVKIPENVRVTVDLDDFADSDVWLVAVPAEFFRENLKKCGPFWKGQPIIICTKGMEAETGKFMSEVVEEELNEADGENPKFGILSGPQFSDEVAHGVPTGSTLAGPDAVFKAAQRMLHGLYLEHTNDIIGAEVCGTGKNAIAILAGFMDAQGRGENEKAMNITLAWNEIVGLGLEMGAKIETFLKLCGLGDLLLSATSKTSRNFAAGMSLGRGEPLADKTTEGISAVYGLINRAAEHNFQMPILGNIRAIIDKNS